MLILSGQAFQNLVAAELIKEMHEIEVCINMFPHIIGFNVFAALSLSLLITCFYPPLSHV